MTEPNKELPKEVVGEITERYGPLQYDRKDKVTEGAQIAQSHYAPIIEGKDKEIAALEKIRDFHIKENNGKDKRIAELEADLKKVMGLLKDVYIQSITDFRESRDVNYEDLPTPNELFEAYCKENNLTDLGGE